MWLISALRSSTRDTLLAVCYDYDARGTKKVPNIYGSYETFNLDIIVNTRSRFALLNGSCGSHRYSDAVAVEGVLVTDFEIEEELPPPETGVRVVYLGPVSPHWDIQGLFGEQAVVDEFRRRTMARLQLLPPHDPQFRRNRERVNRDAERENLHLEWDLGVPEEDEEE